MIQSLFYLFSLVFVCCGALLPAKSMVPPPPYPVVLRRLRHLLIVTFVGPLVTFLFFFFFFSGYFQPPLGPSVSAHFVSVVSPLTDQVDIGLLVFSCCLLLALCLHPLRVFLPSVWSSCDVLMLVHQLAIS